MLFPRNIQKKLQTADVIRETIRLIKRKMAEKEKAFHIVYDVLSSLICNSSNGNVKTFKRMHFHLGVAFYVYAAVTLYTFLNECSDVNIKVLPQT